jgi:hypothetical protein
MADGKQRHDNEEELRIQAHAIPEVEGRPEGRHLKH